MNKISLLLLLLASPARANTPRMGLDLPPFNAPRWDLRLNADWQIVDASAAVLALPNTFLAVNEFNAGAGFGLVRTSTFDALGNLFLSGSSITLTGTNGFITSASSITASAFFGDASHLSNLPGGSQGAVNTAQFSAGSQNFFGADQIRYDTTSGGLKIGDPASAIPTGAISSMTVQSNQALTVAFLSHQEGGPVTMMLGCDVNCGSTHHNPGALRHNYVRGYDTALEGSVNSNIQEAMIYRKGFPTAVNLSFMPQGGADDSPVSIGPLTYNIVFGGSGTFFESPVAFGGYGGGTYYGANPDAFDTYGIARFHNVISLSHLNADPSYFQSYSSMTLTNSTMTLTGQYGTVTSASSITASGFFGDGSQLSNIPTLAQVNSNTSQLTLLAASTTTLSASTATIQSQVNANTAAIPLKVSKAGDTMTGGLIMSNSSITLTGANSQIVDGGTATIQGNAFSVGGSTLAVLNGRVGIRNSSPAHVFEVGSGTFTVNGMGLVGILTESPAYPLDVRGDVSGSGQVIVGSTLTVQGSGFSVAGSTFVVTNGYVGIGTNSPQVQLHIIGTVSTASVKNDQYSNDVVGPAFIGRKARGTVASPSAVLSGDRLFTFGGLGWDGGGIFPSSSTVNIQGFATENWTQGAHGSSITITTTPNGTTTPQVAVTIGNDGSLSAPRSSVTASGFFGDANHLVNYVVTASTEVEGTGESIASLSFVGLATTTVTLRGNRPALIAARVTLNNGSAAAVSITCELTENSVMLDGPHVMQLAKGPDTAVDVFSQLEASTTAGSRQFSVLCKSNSVGTPQTGDDVHINVMEF